jgi:hypothetical protein
MGIRPLGLASDEVCWEGGENAKVGLSYSYTDNPSASPLLLCESHKNRGSPLLQSVTAAINLIW